MSEEKDDKSIDDYVNSDPSPEQESPEVPDQVGTPEPGTDDPPAGEPDQPDETSELPEGLKKRFSKLTADKHRLKSANDEKERKLAELEAKIQKYETKGPERPVKPTLEDDDVDYNEEALEAKMDQYFEDLADWKAQQRLGEYEQKGAVNKILSKKQELAKQHQVRVDESGIEDYNEKLNGLINAFEKEQAPIHDHFVESIQLDENGPRIVEYFAAHPEKAIEISQKGTVQAALEVGRISAKISAGKPLQQTKAPKPVTPVKGSGVKPQDTESYSVSDWVNKDLSHLGFDDR